MNKKEELEMIELNVTYKNGVVERIFVMTEAIIGRKTRDVDVDIDILNDKKISRRHSRIFMKDNKWFIHDLESGNGVFINNSRIKLNSDVQLKDGDVISIGDSSIIFKEKIVIEEEETIVATIIRDKDKKIRTYLECLNGKNKGNSIVLDINESLNITEVIGMKNIDGEVLLKFESNYFFILNFSPLLVKIDDRIIKKNHDCVLIDENIITIQNLYFRFSKKQIGKVVTSNSLDTLYHGKIFAILLIIIVIILSALYQYFTY